MHFLPRLGEVFWLGLILTLVFTFLAVGASVVLVAHIWSAWTRWATAFLNGHPQKSAPCAAGRSKRCA